MELALMPVPPLPELFIIPVLFLNPLPFRRNTILRFNDHDGLLKAGTVTSFLGDGDSTPSFFKPLGHGRI